MWKMPGVSTAACKMSSEFLYQQLTGMYRGRKGAVTEMYFILSVCVFQQPQCDCIYVCVAFCLFFFSPALRHCKSIGFCWYRFLFSPTLDGSHSHTDAHTQICIYPRCITECMQRLNVNNPPAGDMCSCSDTADGYYRSHVLYVNVQWPEQHTVRTHIS